MNGMMTHMYFYQPTLESAVDRLGSYVDRVPYFSQFYQNNVTSENVGNLLFFSFFGPLSPLWSQYLIIPTN